MFGVVAEEDRRRGSRGDTVMRRGWRREQRGGWRLGREPPREGGMSLPGGGWTWAAGLRL
jgi:hypothetical protein